MVFVVVVLVFVASVLLLLLLFFCCCCCCCDILSNLSDALIALEGSLEGIKLGESGDITQIKPEDLTVLVALVGVLSLVFVLL